MDAKENPVNLRQAISFESLRLAELSLDVDGKENVDDKQDADGKEVNGKREVGSKQEVNNEQEIDSKKEVENRKESPDSSSASTSPTIVNESGNEADQAGPTTPERPEDLKLKRRARWALLVMAFFMGDVQDGLGPFLGVYLQQHGWAPGLRGTVSTVSGVATILATGPIGALIDATK